MAYLTLTAFLLIVAVAFCALLIYVMAGQLLRPRRMTDGIALALVGRMSPADLGLPFSAIGFTVRDQHGQPLRLAGWWIPAGVSSDHTVVILHGYADAKIGGIAWAPLWRSFGWNVLAMDLRAHGQSEGRDVTAGFFERDDLDQTLDALRTEKPQATKKLALFGVSLGAAAAAACAARRTDLAAVVLESPFTDYYTAVRAHAARRGMPLVHGLKLVARTAEWISGCDFDAVRPVDSVRRIAAPLLVIHGDMDLFIGPKELATFAAAMAAREEPTEHVVMPGVQHVLGLAVDPDGYATRIGNFLRRCGVD